MRKASFPSTKAILTCCVCVDLSFCILFGLLFATAVFADTVTINWGVDNQTYTTTTCQSGNDVILPTAPTKRGYIFKGWVAEHFDRGTYATWAAVPQSVSLYKKDTYNNTTPLEGDTIVVNNASGYVPYIVIRSGTNQLYASVTINGNTTTYYYNQVTSWFKLTNNISIKYAGGSPGQWRIKSDIPYYVNNVEKSGEILLTYASGTSWGPFNISTEYVDFTGLQGAWKFTYDGLWATDGKSGWKPSEQIVSE